MVTKEQYLAIQYGLKPVEKALIAYYELCWFTKHTVPTVEEVFEHLRKGRPNLRRISVNYYLARHPVIRALENRGIPFREHTQTELTDQQMAAALTVMNFADERSIKDKLDQIGVLPATYYAWLNDPAFKHFVESLSEQNLKNIKPVAVTEFTKLIAKGDWQAIKYYLDVTGAAGNNEAPQTEMLLRMIIEIIQKHVKDPSVIVSIAQDIQLAAANKTLELAAGIKPSIEGSAYESAELDENSPEVREAIHKLGY